MGLNKKTGFYEASNVTFNPAIPRALSYGYWVFVDRIGGLVVFNDYRISKTTAKHQAKVRQLMFELKIEADLRVEAPRGLQDLDCAIRYHLALCEELQEKIKAPRTREAKNKERAEEILTHLAKVDALRSLLAKQKKAN